MGALRESEALRERHPEPAKRRGSWKVSDEVLQDFIRNAKKALSSSSDYLGTDMPNSGRCVPINRTVLGNTGGSVLTAQHGASSSARSISGCSQPSAGSPKKQPQQGQRAVQGVAKPGSIRYRNSVSKSTSLERPPWDKCQSMPNLFAHVGVGLGGKGSRVVSETGQFAEAPIFLSDKTDKS